MSPREFAPPLAARHCLSRVCATPIGRRSPSPMARPGFPNRWPRATRDDLRVELIRDVTARLCVEAFGRGDFSVFVDHFADPVAYHVGTDDLALTLRALEGIVTQWRQA